MRRFSIRGAPKQGGWFRANTVGQRLRTEDAEILKVWYWPGMRRNFKSITTSPEIIKKIAAHTEANFNLLTKLMPWLDANELVQRRFRYAVINKLTRIEAAIALVLVGQQAQMQAKRMEYFADKLEEDAKAADEFISKQSEAAGLNMIRYIHEESQSPEVCPDRRRKWSGWEI